MKLVTRRNVRRRLHSPSLRLRAITNEDDSIEALVHIHRMVLSGVSLPASIAHTVHVRPCIWLDELHSRSSRGEPLDSAARALIDEISGRKHPTHSERDAVVALHVLSVADSIGGRIADQLESLIESLSERHHHRRERRTQAASAAASMRMLTWLPLICGILILTDSREIREFLLGTPAGWLCLSLGIGTNALGRLWLAREVSAC